MAQDLLVETAGALKCHKYCLEIEESGDDPVGILLHSIRWPDNVRNNLMGRFENAVAHEMRLQPVAFQRDAELKVLTTLAVNCALKADGGTLKFID